MRFRASLPGLLFVVGSLALPLAAHAGIPYFGPIIPQDGINGVCPAGFGMLMVVINNIISIALTLAIAFVAPIMIAYSGFLYVVNPADPGGISKAKSILWNTVIGIVIALAGWMIVDAVMAVLYNPGTQNGQSTLGVWADLLTTNGEAYCLPQAGALPGYVPPPAVGVSVVPQVAPQGIPQFSPTLSQSQIASRITAANNYREQVCTAANLNGVGDQCNRLIALLGVESGGNANAGSGAGALGLMQLIPTTAASMGVSACSGSSNSAPSSDCVAALKDPTTNINAGVKLYANLYNKLGNVDNATAAYNGGDSNLLKSNGLKGPLAPSSNCPGLLAWQCPINPGGLAETQAYVANINAIQAKLTAQGY